MVVLAGVFCATVLFPVNANSQLPGYNFTVIRYPSVTGTQPEGINDYGQVVGTWYASSTANPRNVSNGAFIYSSGVFSAFSVAGARFGRPTDINNSGEIVGNYNLDSGPSSFIYGADGYTPIALLGSLPTYAYGMNDSREIVGDYPLSDRFRGFLYKGGVFNLIDFPGALHTLPSGINSAGKVVGGYSDGARTHGFLYDGTYTTIDFPGSYFTDAEAINGLGQIVGYYNPSFGRGTHGFLYDHGTFTTFDFPGSSFTSLKGINNHGQVVGEFSGPACPVASCAFIATPATISILPLEPSRQFSVNNGASFATTSVAPGALASVIAATGVGQSVSAGVFSNALPKTLGGVTLKFGGSINFNISTKAWDYSPIGSIEAALHFVGPSQVNFQIPTGIAPGANIPAQLTKPDGSTLLSTVHITATAPGIFSVLQNGQGQGAVLIQDNSQNFGTNPAKRGSVIQIYATGGGETTPSLLSGEAAPASGNPLVVTNVQPAVTIGGVNARVLFSGMAPGYVGLWQINAVVPQAVAPGAALPLVVTSGGVASNTVTIAVE